MDAIIWISSPYWVPIRSPNIWYFKETAVIICSALISMTLMEPSLNIILPQNTMSIATWIPKQPEIQMVVLCRDSSLP